MSRNIVDFNTMDINLQNKINKDVKLNALRKMRDFQTNKETAQEIQEFIDQRVLELIREYREG